GRPRRLSLIKTVGSKKRLPKAKQVAEVYHKKACGASELCFPTRPILSKRCIIFLATFPMPVYAKADCSNSVKALAKPMLFSRVHLISCIVIGMPTYVTLF